MKRISSKLFFMAKSRCERCPYCGFLDVIKWGKQCGHSHRNGSKHKQVFHNISFMRPHFKTRSQRYNDTLFLKFRYVRIYRKSGLQKYIALIINILTIEVFTVFFRLFVILEHLVIFVKNHLHICDTPTHTNSFGQSPY